MTWLFVLVLCWNETRSDSGAPIYLGKQQARYRFEPKQPLRLPEYHNNGYRQKVTQHGQRQLVQVVVENSKLASRSPARPVQGLPASFTELQQGLNGEQHQTLADQVAYLFHWMQGALTFENTFEEDQSLERVMSEKRATCVGLATLAVFVLDHMGVDARHVSGVAFRNNDQVELHMVGNVLHRWIEIRYPDVGWVFADPAGKVNFVDATYVILGVDGVHPRTTLLQQAWGSRIELLKWNNGFRMIGRQQHLDNRLRIRPNRLMVHQP